MAFLTSKGKVDKLKALDGLSEAQAEALAKALLPHTRELNGFILV